MKETLFAFVQAASDWAVPVLFLIIAGVAVLKKVKVYEEFIEGAKEGFNVGIRIIPYVVAILCAIAIFRASGALDATVNALSGVLAPLSIPPEILPMAIVRPLSGSGAMGVLSEGLKTYGPDSLIGNMMSVLMGSTETTFYVLAVYFGSVAVRRTRHTLAACLVGDVTGILAAIYISNWFFS
ncbi:MAG: spore maturation protein [bacterium]|nr:spore maturation protein [bacterium]